MLPLNSRFGLDICSVSTHGLGQASQRKQLQQFSLAWKVCCAADCSALAICTSAKKQIYKKRKLKRNSGFCNAFEEIYRSMEKTVVLLLCFQKRCYWSCLLETHKMPEFTDTYHRFPSYKLILCHISRPLSSSMESDTGFSLSIRRHLKLIWKCSTVMRLKALKHLLLVSTGNNGTDGIFVSLAIITS